MKWIKDNGQEIETNELEATIDKCIQLGWKHKKKEENSEELKEGSRTWVIAELEKAGIEFNQDEKKPVLVALLENAKAE